MSELETITETWNDQLEDIYLVLKNESMFYFVRKQLDQEMGFTLVLPSRGLETNLD